LPNLEFPTPITATFLILKTPIKPLKVLYYIMVSVKLNKERTVGT